MIGKLVPFLFVLGLALGPRSPSFGQDFPKPLATPCDNYGSLDKRPGFKRDDPDVFFQWIAAQAKINRGKWCLYYAVKNLHATNNLSFRWPTAHLEKALLGPAGVVSTMTSPVNPGAPRDNDPLYYGAATPPPPAALTTTFDVPASGRDYPGRITIEVNAIALGSFSSPGEPRLDVRGFVFSSTVERRGAAFKYQWAANAKSVGSTADAFIGWYPTRDPEFVKAWQQNFPTATYGEPVPLKKGVYVSSNTVRSGPPTLAFTLAQFRLQQQIVLVVSVPVFRPDR